MARICHDPIRAATGEAFDDDEIDAIVDRMRRAYQRQKKKAPSSSDIEAMDEAARALTREELMGALIQRRLEATAKAAAAARDTRLDGLLTIAGTDEADALRAYNVGTEKQGPFAGSSVDAEGTARRDALWGQVERGLAQHPGLAERMVSKWLGVADEAFEADVRREMWIANGGEGVESTGNAEARAAAEVFVKSLEDSRRMQNAEGAWIGRIAGYMGRQSHDRLKVAGGFWRELRAGGLTALVDWTSARMSAERQAFRQWRDTIRPLLHDRTFEGIDAEDVRLTEDAAQLHAAGVIDDPADIEERFLYRAWFDIVTGAHEVLSGASDLGEFRPPPGKARAVSKSRVLHFRGPDEAGAYARAFGPRGGLYSSVMQDLDRAGRNAALMARWGPSPEAAYQNTVGQLTDRARQRGAPGAATRLQAAQRRAEFDELTGATSSPDNLRLAIVGRTIRSAEVLSKLGGMVLSALSDASLAAQATVRAGGTYLDGYGAVLAGVSRMQSEDGKRVADLLDVGSRSGAAQLTGRFAASDGPLGWTAWAQRLFYKVNGFEFWAEGLRRGVAEMYAAHLGSEAGKAFAAIEPGTRETLERFGVTPAAWDLIRRGATTMSDGRTYLTFDALGQISDAEAWRLGGLTQKAQRTADSAARVRADYRLRLQTLVGSVLDDAMTEPRARERAGLHRGAKAGTIFGEAARTFTQFWGFSNAIIGRHVAPAMRGYAGKSPVSLLAHLIVASTALGYLSLQAKELVKGHNPRPLFGEDGTFHGRQLVIASLLQGGGFGIYGDFLFGEANRSGLPATLSAFAGPAVSDAERLLHIVNLAVWGDAEGHGEHPRGRRDARQQAGAEAVRWGVSELPGSNLFYTRLGLDYLVLWRLQEALNPGYIDRYQHRLARDQGVTFWLDPQEAVGQ